MTSDTATLIRFAAQQPPSRARAVVDAILAKAAPENGAQTEAVASFERDMRPIVNAVAAALHAGDRHALEGLRALLPTLLEQIKSPELADVLAREMGRAWLAGITTRPEVQP